jgi:hypothetical protein
MTTVNRALVRDILNAAVESAKRDRRDHIEVSIMVLADAAYLLSDETWQTDWST